MEWISCKKALPPDNEVVIVSGERGGVYLAIHNYADAPEWWGGGWWKLNSKKHECNPLAWMALPPAYKGD